MYILIADLHEYRTRICQQITHHGQPVAQIGKVTLDAVAPSVSEGLNLLGFTGNVLEVAIPYVTAGRRPLKIGIELDPVWRINVDALYLPPKTFPLGQRRHDLKAISQNHTVGPIRVVLIELGFGFSVGQTVEIRKKVNLGARFLGP